jgi:translation initiation factor 2B subunit (eIF-2B alpha/beta/delta family)
LNAQNIWAGHDYAYVSYRPRGVTLPKNARKVRAIKLSKEHKYGSERATTMVEVHDYTSGRELRVRARDIIDFWDSYNSQIQVWREEQERMKKELEAQAAERAQDRDLILTSLRDADLDVHPRDINSTLRTVTLSYDQLRWLLNARSERKVY